MDFTLFVPAFPIPRNSISEDSTRNRVTRARPNFKSIPLCPIRYRSDRRNSVLKNPETCFEAVPRLGSIAWKIIDLRFVTIQPGGNL